MSALRGRLTDGREFDIDFFHGRELHVSGGTVRTTSCRVMFSLDTSSGWWHALCSPRDRYIKEKGRKLALARAIAALNMVII